MTAGIVDCYLAAAHSISQSLFLLWELATIGGRRKTKIVLVRWEILEGGGQASKIITESVSVKKDKQGFSKSMPSGLSQKKEVPQQKVADSLKSLSDRICYFFCLECDHIKKNLANLWAQWGKVLSREARSFFSEKIWRKRTRKVSYSRE